MNIPMNCRRCGKPLDQLTEAQAAKAFEQYVAEFPNDPKGEHLSRASRECYDAIVTNAGVSARVWAQREKARLN